MKRWCLALSLLFAAGCVGQTSRPASSPAAMRRADAAYQRGEYAEAVLLYRAYLDGEVPDDQVVQANYRMAASYYRLGRYDEAAQVLEDLRTQYPDEQWPIVYTLYGDAEHARGHNLAALIFWERAYIAAPDNERAQLSTRINALIDEMSDAEREQARPISSTDFVWRALNSPRRPTAVRTPKPEATSTPTASPGPESVRIGVLLPLSGKRRALGSASLDGARIAVERDGDLAPVDSLGTTGGSISAYDALQRDSSIVAIVGPLGSDETAVVAPRANSGSVSLLPLSQSEGLGGSYVFQTSMTRLLQAQTLAAYAVRKLGMRRFAVIHPNDSYGSRFSDLFRDAAVSEGATVVGTVVYKQGQSDFTDNIDQLQALDARSRIDAVFLPDSAETVALLAPEIRRQMPSLQLLGSSQWNEASVLAGVARSLEGAIFVDGFFADSSRPATRAFVEKFRRRFGRRPGLLEAQAHDAAALVEATVRRGAFSRQEIQLMLFNLGLFEGAGGNLEISDGVVRRQLFLLRFHGGDLEELSW